MKNLFKKRFNDFYKPDNSEDDVMTFDIDDLSSDCIVDIASRV